MVVEAVVVVVEAVAVVVPKVSNKGVMDATAPITSSVTAPVGYPTLSLLLYITRPLFSKQPLLLPQLHSAHLLHPLTPPLM